MDSLRNIRFKLSNRELGFIVKGIMERGNNEFFNYDMSDVVFDFSYSYFKNKPVIFINTNLKNVEFENQITIYKKQYVKYRDLDKDNILKQLLIDLKVPKLNNNNNKEEQKNML